MLDKKILDQFIEDVIETASSNSSKAAMHMIHRYARYIFMCTNEPKIGDFAFAKYPRRTELGIIINEFLAGRMNKLSFKNDVENIFGF